MTREEAIIEVCAIVALAYRSIGDYSKPSDGFCERCMRLQGGNFNYQNAGEVIEYVRLAVVKQLKMDGYSIHHSFDPKTGKEK